MITLVSKRTKGKQLTLPGDWRRRRGTKTDAHLYDPLPPDMGGWTQRPTCGRRIPRADTIAMVQGQPCADCLVAAIRATGHGATA